eukprot:TRINITY_DN45_c0_g1_i1.p1 TRINITY_DN45_c0_g1~~TRINITY_DN45_c0_g1_i1.p1  ORF type:complete len:2028 (-),score=149.77 TRINITY_DN45_c0_g1_i1:98-5482(-)
MTDSADPECAPFLSNCFAKVKSSSYGSKWNRFRIEFTNKIPLSFPNCNELFNSTANPIFKTGSISCTRLSDTSIEVDVSDLSQPILNYSFADKVMKDACGIYLPSNPIENVAVPTLEVVFIGWNSTDKCMGLTIRSTIEVFFVWVDNYQKPYPWPIERLYWEVTYEDSSGIPLDTINRLSFINEINETSIRIPDYDLFPLKVLQVRARIRTPYKAYVASNLLSITVPVIASGKKHCGPCQLDNRMKCAQFNGVCWKDYSDYTVTEPFNTTDCLKAMAPVCYSIWNSSTLDNSQCLDFKSSYNFTAMKIKPNATSARYSSSGKSIYLIFDQPTAFKGISDCSGVFDQSTLNWLPPSRACSWTSPTSLEIEYNPEIGIMEVIVLKEDAFFYDYPYSQEPADPTVIKISVPSLETIIKITGITSVTERDTVDLFGVMTTPTLYPLVFKWDLVHDPPLSETLAEEATEYFAQFKNYSRANALTIPTKFLISGSRITVSLTAKAAEFVSNLINTTSMVTVFDDVPKIKYTSKSQLVLEMDGSKSNRIPFQIENENINAENDFIPVDVSFSVTSGSFIEAISTHSPYESALESNITSEYAKYKALFLGKKQGFKYLEYYNITTLIKSRRTGKVNADSLILYFTKPPVKSIIDTPGSLVSITDDVQLNGLSSEFPAVEEDEIGYSWKCITATTMNIGGECSCPILPDSELGSPIIKIPKEKLANKCKYRFSLTVSATLGSYKRTAYNETEFMTFAKPMTYLRGKVIKSTSNNAVKDMYFTFGMADKNPDTQVNYKWKAVEVVSKNPKVTTRYSEKNTLLYDFFKEELKSEIDPAIKEEDTPVPVGTPVEELQPRYLTSKTGRVLGIDKKSLLPMHKYTFGTIVNYTTVPTLLFTSFETPPAPQPRKLFITPTVGIAFKTPFTFTFTLLSSTGVDEAQYQIYKRNCPSTNTKATPLTQLLSQSNSYTATLAPGLKSCDYKVEIILKVFEYEDSIELKEVVTVKEPESPVQEVLKTQFDKLKANTDLTMDQKFTMLAEISSTEVIEASDPAKEIVDAIYKELDAMDQPGGMLEVMDNNTKLSLINATAATVANLVINHQANIDMLLATSMANKVDNYLTEVKTIEGGTYIIPTSIATLSGIADIGINEQKETKFFTSIQSTMDKMTDMVLEETLPGAAPYNITSPDIDMIVMKDHAEDYDQPKSFTTYNGATISLPGGLADQMLKDVKHTAGSIVTFGASVYSTSFNPFATIKNNTNISIESLTPGSTQGYKPETVQRIYTDLAKGKLTEVINVKKQSLNLLQLKIKPFEFQKNASEKALSSNITIGFFPEGKKAKFSFPFSKGLDGYINRAVMTPLHYQPEGQVWTNKNCSLDAPNASDTFLLAECSHAGSSTLSKINEGFTITVDVVEDVITVIAEGNYEELGNFRIFKKDASKTAVAVISVVSIFAFLIIVQLLLIRMDRNALYSYRLECLSNRHSPKEAPVHIGALHRIFDFFSQVQSKGFLSTSKENQRIIVPVRRTTETGLKRKIKKQANGFTLLSIDEKKELDDAFALYRQCTMIYDEKELKTIMAKELEKSKILQRITQAYIDDRTVNSATTFYNLMINEHPVLNSITKAEIKTPRFVKFLSFMCVLVGQLFVTGYFYNSDSNNEASLRSENFLSTSIIYSIAATLLMIPLKLIISIFLTGGTLVKDMKREEIVAVERNTQIYRKIGYVLSYGWMLGCLYAIMMYIINFSDISLNSWMLTFGASAFIEMILIAQLKILLKVLVGLLLMRLSRSRYMLTAAGLIASKLISWLTKLF